MRQPNFEDLLSQLQEVPPGGRLDLRENLFSLARIRRLELQTRVAVVAGSAGKTSVKELLASMLKAAFADKCYSTPDNHNTKIALAGQILRLPENCEVAVFEMGARRVNDFIVPLSYLQPAVVALLNIGSAHVGEFGSRENLIREKLSCLSVPSAKTIVVSADDDAILAEALKTRKSVVAFGVSERSDVRLLEETFSSVRLRVRGQDVQLECPLLCSAKGLNMAAAVAMALALDLPMDAVRIGLRSFSGVPRRFQPFSWGTALAVDDAFNASPESMQQGLRALQQVARGKKVLLVLGSMLELGPFSDEEHRRVASQVSELFREELVEQRLGLVTVGEEAFCIGQELILRGLRPEFHRHCGDASVARAPVLEWRNEFEIVYFKGSKGLQLQKIFGGS